MEALRPGSLIARVVTVRGPWVCLAGREHLVEVRKRRQMWARRLWPKAVAYARQVAALPFVRMVAVTGALAVDNVQPHDDIDLFIITEPGRLWLCRGLVILLVRWAARRGDVICPNYFLSSAALRLPERDLFTAHKVAQMVPVAAHDVYREFRRQNAWTARWLPNAVGPPRWVGDEPVSRAWRRCIEPLLRSPVGAVLETWERNRKVRRFAREAGDHPEAYFSPDHCKGHFGGHRQAVLTAFWERWQHVRRVLDIVEEATPCGLTSR